MTGFWDRISGRSRPRREDVELTQMGVEDRHVATEDPIETGLDLRVESQLGGTEAPGEFDDVEKLLGGPTS
jgi:hypothetical protein